MGAVSDNKKLLLASETKKVRAKVKQKKPDSNAKTTTKTANQIPQKHSRSVAAVPRWTRELQSEEFSRMLAYHGDHILRQRRWMKSINGPGWHDPQFPTAMRTCTFPKQERFHYPWKSKAFAVTGPGTYGKNHDPYCRIEEKSHAKGFSHCVLSSFEQKTQKTPRGKAAGAGLSLHLPCNLYNLKNSIDELINKRVSKRGPYDLFTGNRFPEKTGYNTKLYLNTMDSSNLNHPKNAFKGKFLKCGMKHQITARLVLTDLALCPKNPNDPGPSYYDPYPHPVVRPFKYPFNSTGNGRVIVRSILVPPPGRYNPRTNYQIIGDGMKSAFLSKTKRNVPAKCDSNDVWLMSSTAMSISNVRLMQLARPGTEKLEIPYFFSCF